MNPVNTNISQSKLWLILSAATLLAIFSRLIPHPYNMSPVSAIALFSGAFIARKKWAFILPLLAVIGSDIIMEITNPGMGFYPGQSFVYVSYLLVSCLGYIIGSKPRFRSILFASLGGSVVFFLVSNFGSWVYLDMYPKTLSGLMEAYTMALPFAKGTFVGDLLYNGLLFGSLYLLGRSREARVSHI